MDLVDRNELKKHTVFLRDEDKIIAAVPLKDISEAKASESDVVPVVRCKNCKHSKIFKDDNTGNDWYFCLENESSWRSVYPNGFCNLGERK